MRVVKPALTSGTLPGKLMTFLAHIDMGATLAVWILALLLTVGALWIMGTTPFGRHFVRIAARAMFVALAASALVPILRWHLIWFTPLVLFVAYDYAFRRLFTLAFRAQRLVKALGGTDRGSERSDGPRRRGP